MKLLRWKCLFLVGLPAVIFTAVLYWPVSPVWESPVIDSCTILGFDESGRSLFTFEADTSRRIVIAPVVERDVASGRVLRRTLLPIPSGRHLKSSPRLLTRNRVLVLHESIHSGQVDSTQTEVFDIATGRSVGGPYEVSKALLFGESPGGRWMYGRAYDEPSIVIVSAEGGVTSRIPNQGVYLPAFSPDEAHVARIIHENRAWFLVVHDLPSGQERVKVLLPRETPWGYVKAWRDGEFILGTLHGEAGRGVVRSDCYSLKILTDSLGEPKWEPDLFETSRYYISSRGNRPYTGSTSNTLHGSDLIVRCQKGVPEPQLPWVHVTLAWIEQHLRFELRSTDTDRVSIQVIDRPTGKVLRHFSASGCRFPVQVSPNGLRAASFTKGRGLLMWDLDATSRWPWALFYALLPSALWLTLRRWRRRSPLQQSACPAPPTPPGRPSSST